MFERGDTQSMGDEPITAGRFLLSAQKITRLSGSVAGRTSVCLGQNHEVQHKTCQSNGEVQDKLSGRFLYGNI